MSQTAKAQEPSMEEILASIRRIIADDDASKQAKPAKPGAPEPAAAAAPPPPPSMPSPTPSPEPPPAANSQAEIDAMMADLHVAPKPAELSNASPPPDLPKPAVATPPAEVLELTEAMTAAPPSPVSPPAPSFRTIDAAADVVFADRLAEPLRAADDSRRHFTPAAAPERALLSSSTETAVDRAFNSLAHTVLGANARTLEDLVKEMLRPLLKSWLDDNLPSMVERIVRAEIERVSRGRP